MTHQEHKMPGSGETAQQKDPVCGMTVKADSPHELGHAGRNYVFCSTGCLEKFRKEPARYTA